MSLSASGRHSIMQRLIAGVCAVGLLFGVTACRSGGEEPLIHANHDEGVKLEDVDNYRMSRDEIRAMQERLEKWGVEQTPEWLEICNAINRKALRKLRFNPQRDLWNRDSKLPNACIWKSGIPPSYVALGLSDESIAELDKSEDFVLKKVVNVDGMEIHLGHRASDLPDPAGCVANFEKNGKIYLLEYIRLDFREGQEPPCNIAIELARDS